MVRLSLACVLSKFNKRVLRSELNVMFSRDCTAESGFVLRDWAAGRKTLALKLSWKILTVLMWSLMSCWQSRTEWTIASLRRMLMLYLDFDSCIEGGVLELLAVIKITSRQRFVGAFSSGY